MGHENLLPEKMWAMSATACNEAPGNSKSGWRRSATHKTVETVSEPNPSIELDLLRRIAAGESPALGKFYDLHAGTLFALAFRILSDAKEAEDVVQEALLQLWQKAGSFDAAQGRPLAWVLALTRNKAIDRLRAAQRRARLAEEAGAEVLLEAELPGATGADIVHAGEQAELVRGALRQLPTEQRRAIEMAFYGGLSQTEIAAALNEPLGTIKARIRRGMGKLREELELRV